MSPHPFGGPCFRRHSNGRTLSHPNRFSQERGPHPRGPWPGVDSSGLMVSALFGQFCSLMQASANAPTQIKSDRYRLENIDLSVATLFPLCPHFVRRESLQCRLHHVPLKWLLRITSRWDDNGQQMFIVRDTKMGWCARKLTFARIPFVSGLRTCARMIREFKASCDCSLTGAEPGCGGWDDTIGPNDSITIDCGDGGETSRGRCCRSCHPAQRCLCTSPRSAEGGQH